VLKEGVAESDEISETIAATFLDGGMGVEDFIKQYRDGRKVYHQRAIKLNRVLKTPSVLTK
jgi:hypothetical protein